MLRNLWERYRSRLREPIVADRRLDVASGLSWLLLGLWGVFRSISGQSIITHDTAAVIYSIVWGSSIAVLASVSGIAALSTLFGMKASHSIVKQSIELVALSLFAGTLTTVTFLQIVAVFTNDFAPQSIATAIITSFFLVLPTWRIFHLTDRIRVLRKIVEKK